MIWQALARGYSKVFQHPLVMLGVWFVLFLYSGFGTLALKEYLEASIGKSVVADSLKHGFDMEWYREFYEGARGLASNFSPTVVGPGPVFDSLENWLEGNWFVFSPSLILFLLGFYILWSYLVGGILDRYHQSGVHRKVVDFHTAAARFFPRMLSLAIIPWPVYGLVYGKFEGWLFSRIEQWTRNDIHEWHVMLWTLAGYLVSLFLIIFTSVVFDYARIITVVDNRWNMFFSIYRGLVFVVLHPMQTLGIYFVLGGCTLTLGAFYAWWSPGVGEHNPLAVLVSFILSQVYMALHIIVKLGFYGCQLALYESYHPGRVILFT